TKIPKLRQFIARHLGSSVEPRFKPILRWIEERHDDAGTVRDVLTGLQAAVEGRRNSKSNPEWKAAAIRLVANNDPVIREMSHRISLVQGNDDSFAYFQQVVKDEKLASAVRERALSDLITTLRPAVADLLLERLNDPVLRSTAIRGLAGFDRKEVG